MRTTLVLLTLALLLGSIQPLTVPSIQTLYKQNVAWTYAVDAQANDVLFVSMVCTRPTVDAVIYVFAEGMQIIPDYGGVYEHKIDDIWDGTDESQSITISTSGLYYVLFSNFYGS